MNMVGAPFEREPGRWYVQLVEGLSGPWRSEEAAQYAADGDMTKAAMVENRLTQKRDRRPRHHRRRPK